MYVALMKHLHVLMRLTCLEIFSQAGGEGCRGCLCTLRGPLYVKESAGGIDTRQSKPKDNELSGLSVESIDCLPQYRKG